MTRVIEEQNDQVSAGAFDWTSGGLRLVFTWGVGEPVRLVTIEAADSPPASSRRPYQPLVELGSPAHGHADDTVRFEGSVLGQALRYRRHRETSEGDRRRLAIEQADEATGLEVASVFETIDDAPAVRCWTTLSLREGSAPLPIQWVTSLATGAFISDDLSSLRVWRASTSWGAENRWSSQTLRSSGLAAIDPDAVGENSRNRISASTLSSWSSAFFNPAGAAENTATGATLAWQIEHNGAWHWELGEKPDHNSTPRLMEPAPRGRPLHEPDGDGAYLALLGPTDLLHHWSVTLRPGERFDSVPVAFAPGADLESAFAALATHRRAARRTHPQNSSLPVIFNDFMDTLEGDPTEQKLLPLIDAAARVGAEYFCIDAGWYDDTAGWWASVGDWRPSTARFPHGLGAVIDRIRALDMVPGLWMEPEVIGVTSEAAARLPDAAFLSREGVRIRERGRYFLDMRHPAARAHLDEAVDRLVEEFGLGYFKFDYNITPGAGTDANGESPGAGLLEHNRALLDWLDDLLARHEGLVIENCASGAMRSDFAMLGVLQLQSTSDQQDPLLYPAIAVGALAHILPEQAGNWAYPQPAMTDEQIVFTMCTGIAGRLYQAGVLSEMSERQLDLVATGVDVHKRIRSLIARSAVGFPTGLPEWAEACTSVSFETPEETVLVVWRQAGGPREIVLEHPSLSGEDICVLYPPEGIGTPWQAEHDDARLRLTIPAGEAAARVYRISRAG